MKTVEFELNGQTWHLCLNAAALFEIYDKFGREGSVLDPLRAGGAEGFRNACWYLSRLAAQGELVRRWEGYDPGPLPAEAQFRALLSPLDLPRAEAAIAAAASLGFGREIAPEKRRRDPFLEEFEKKTASPTPAPTTSRSVRSFWASLFGSPCS